MREKIEPSPNARRNAKPSRRPRRAPIDARRPAVSSRAAGCVSGVDPRDSPSGGFAPLDEEIRNTPSSVTLEYSRWLMGREWPWHTSGALAGACMAIAQHAPEVCGCEIRRKPLGCPHDRDRKGWRRRRAGRLHAGVSAVTGNVSPERTSHEGASRDARARVTQHDLVVSRFFAAVVTGQVVRILSRHRAARSRSSVKDVFLACACWRKTRFTIPDPRRARSSLAPR